MNCLNRAHICASSAIGADIRIYFVDVTFRYRFYRTLVDACSASSTIVINFVSHFFYFFNNNEGTKVPIFF